MSDEYPIVTISYQPIELCKLLKIANMVSGGGEAKIVISEGYVYLNGEVEFQKRKKVYDNDVIEFNGDVVQVVCSNLSASKPVKAHASPQANKKAKGNSNPKSKNKSQNKAQNNKPDNVNSPQFVDNFAEPGKPAKRRPISF
ncbi:RNA-binding S4 domain-containing protein [Pseudocolwellia sp. HL-MZ7]|uniref:RNA-binding S4 domain-containing protein n=1 Tax=Pseudocolwellia sp. HL-MZ7 TaxID=3400627 RepID=UPI003CEEEF64